MRFHADVQIHSKYSRATSRNADLENLALWGRKKGVTVVGTGDFTHPAWLADIKEKLVPAEPGLFRLRPDLERDVERQTPGACAARQRFLLEVEISTIYKKGGKVRKVHHLIFVPDIDSADRLVARLSRIGNLASDGRPILGLDSRDLLEITLETGPHSYLVPAHIWTPWFAALGSKSGFDSIDDCYGDLASHIFAVETGLSSDPAMNWRIASLDRFRLVSNSDAHSPPKIGREATTYDTNLDYFAMLEALKTGEGFIGTVEFFPEEGKYHMDGHRKCGVRLTPEETKAHDGICPVCGEGLTVGVSHRIDSLADRTEAEARAAPPPKAAEVLSLVPLAEILAEIKGVGPASKAVAQGYERLLATLGSELAILETVPIEDIARAGDPLLGEAIDRLRRGEVKRQAGYDGEYGVIRLFTDDELREATSGGLLFDLPAQAKPAPAQARGSRHENTPADPPEPVSLPISGLVENSMQTGTGLLAGLDPDQRAAAEIFSGPLLIEAGPGSGKTRTLTHRIAHMVAEHGVPVEACLAITFTRRAAQEMRERLARLLPDEWQRIPIHTLHSLGLDLLRENPAAAGLEQGFEIADDAERLAIICESLDISQRQARGVLNGISRAKRTGAADTDETATALGRYETTLSRRNRVDFDDLVARTLRLLEAHPDIAERTRDRFGWISVDEFQDVDNQQYSLLKLLAGADGNLCVIGDADQAIYGFRGADAASMARFRVDYPDAPVVRLSRNYRSTGAIVKASAQVIAQSTKPSAKSGSIAEAVRDTAALVEVHSSGSEQAEAEFVVHTIEQLLGGHSFFSIDSGRTKAGKEVPLSFSDIAVLYRMEAQAGAIEDALERSGMPFQKQANRPLSDNAGVAAYLRALDSQARDGLSLQERLEAATDGLASREQDWTGDLETARHHLHHLAATCDGDAARFAEAVALANETDLWDPRADRISLMTLHAAKGLEFPIVFIIGAEEGVLPLYWGTPDEAALEEERRLFYVGMTRAEDRLFLSHAQKRMWRGKLREMAPSRYLADIATGLIERSETRAHRPKPADRQHDLFL